MNRPTLFVCVLISANIVSGMALPATAGTWDPYYVWDSGKTLYEGSSYTRLVEWGEPAALTPESESIYREGGGTYATPKVPDRQGRMNDQYGGELDWTGPAGGKVKWRFDRTWSTGSGGDGNNYPQVPPFGHAPDYTIGVPFAITLGVKVCSGTELLSYATASGYTGDSFVAGEDGHPRIATGGASGKMDLQWFNTPASITPTAGGSAFESNWKPSNATVAGATGNWLMPANTWATIEVVFNNDAAHTWDAYLVRDGFANGHMWGVYTGSPDSAPSDNFGITSTKSSRAVAWDYLAFGWGAENIQIIPEPATLVLIGLAGCAAARRRTAR